MQLSILLHMQLISLIRHFPFCSQEVDLKLHFVLPCLNIQTTECIYQICNNINSRYLCRYKSYLTDSLNSWRVTPAAILYPRNSFCILVNFVYFCVFLCLICVFCVYFVYLYTFCQVLTQLLLRLCFTAAFFSAALLSSRPDLVMFYFWNLVLNDT